MGLFVVDKCYCGLTFFMTMRPGLLRALAIVHVSAHHDKRKIVGVYAKDLVYLKRSSEIVVIWSKRSTRNLISSLR